MAKAALAAARSGESDLFATYLSAPYLSQMRVRLLTMLVLMDPVLQYRFVDLPFGYSTLALSAVRRDLWPSCEAAAASMGRSDFY